ncbi:ParB N-terminal domain-containing protein [Faecalicatena sp. AGMB00832]|uniref:ParB N-terminal domain-containing protein n=1 Tax=Faecalicatena faecalis TaxID=2726362 RepID=A0ABS6D255_9FIRM|nr:ParB N-terminal domain-containing protein [Faecalicatena faecalis]MBU3875673.1 ParB N-terminal domain-containing protein [Faecalicatena faecalis]
MAFNIMDILNSKTAGSANVEQFEEIKLNYKDIIVTKHNKYSMDEIEELAAGIQMAGELQQPLVLGRVNGEYWLVSGHRRIEATDLLVREGEEQFAMVNCRYKDMTEVEFRIQLLIGNTFNRKMTDYDRMTQAAEWKEVLQQAKKEGTFKPEKGTRTREYVAQILGVSSATVGELERINNNATDSVKEQLKEGNLNMTSAAEASRLPEEDQNAIAEAAAAGEDVKSEQIREMAEGKKEDKQNKATQEQLQPHASDTDTMEEEKENARRLHALKMLEKYYIYMNEEEVRILEAMLEDCKRRKREYGLEDVGETA